MTTDDRSAFAVEFIEALPPVRLSAEMVQYT
jgi:hypothetical protein